MLHEVSAEAGLGFCHAALPELLPVGYHGPLVVALDSNVLIDFQTHGSEMLNDEIGVAEAKYAEELRCLATLLNLWMLRDIRFVVTPRARSDAKRSIPGFDEMIDGLAESLAFQFGDWTYPAPSNEPAPPPVGDEHGLPPGADRDLVLEAQAAGAHTFVTRDRRVLRRTVLTGPPMRICAPSDLADELVTSGVGLMAGGLCEEQGCPYGNTMTPAPDIGKWGPLFAHFEDE
ncbi:hypothetical protein ACOACQ_03370 [Nocardioides sp. CPCC 206347]|uniref:hypothetical protein n=1 Tax=unclassified Nocardioides TaxID=2615069 RepID=UPI00360B2820